MHFPLKSAAQAIEEFEQIHWAALRESGDSFIRRPQDPDKPFAFEYAYEREGVALTWIIEIEPPGEDAEACAASVYVHLGATEPDDADDPYFIEFLFTPGAGWKFRQGIQRLLNERRWRLNSSVKGSVLREFVLYVICSAIRKLKSGQDRFTGAFASHTA